MPKLPSSEQNKDPVCGMNVDPTRSQYKTNFQQKSYNFCCQDCLNKFKQNPERYSK